MDPPRRTPGARRPSHLSTVENAADITPSTGHRRQPSRAQNLFTPSPPPVSSSRTEHNRTVSSSTDRQSRTPSGGSLAGPSATSRRPSGPRSGEQILPDSSFQASYSHVQKQKMEEEAKWTWEQWEDDENRIWWTVTHGICELTHLTDPDGEMTRACEAAIDRYEAGQMPEYWLRLRPSDVPAGGRMSALPQSRTSFSPASAPTADSSPPQARASRGRSSTVITSSASENLARLALRDANVTFTDDRVSTFFEGDLLPLPTPAPRRPTLLKKASRSLSEVFKRPAGTDKGKRIGRPIGPVDTKIDPEFAERLREAVDQGYVPPTQMRVTGEMGEGRALLTSTGGSSGASDSEPVVQEYTPLGEVSQTPIPEDQDRARPRSIPTAPQNSPWVPRTPPSFQLLRGEDLTRAIPDPALISSHHKPSLDSRGGNTNP